MILETYMTLEHFKAVVPLIAVLLTAALSGYIIPKITRKSQDNQKELEIKTSLMTEINDVIMQIMIAIQRSERNAIEQKDFHEAYQNWEVQRAVLLGKFNVYFDRDKITSDFEEFLEIVNVTYTISGAMSIESRNKQINKLKQYFGENTVDWKKLADFDLRKENEENFRNWFTEWWKLRQAVLERKNAVIRDMLEAPITFFHSKR